MIDKELLNCVIQVAGLTLEQFCSSIGMSRTSFYRKCNGITKFDISEVQKIAEALKMNDEMVISIFVRVRNYEQLNLET